MNGGSYFASNDPRTSSPEVRWPVLQSWQEGLPARARHDPVVVESRFAEDHGDGDVRGVPGRWRVLTLS
jgi:hypothetical protein